MILVMMAWILKREIRLERLKDWENWGLHNEMLLYKDLEAAIGGYKLFGNLIGEVSSDRVGRFRLGIHKNPDESFVKDLC